MKTTAALFTLLLMACQPNAEHVDEGQNAPLINYSASLEYDFVNAATIKTSSQISSDIETPPAITFPDIDTLDFRANYKALKARVTRKRRRLADAFSRAGTQSSSDSVLAQARRYLYEVLTDEVFPAWYGTEWDFNGYTNNPREGMVACGYFVSTTLKHAGFNLNRYDVAKSYSHLIVQVLTDSGETVYNAPGTEVVEQVKKGAPGLYVVGLSNHVGFLDWDGDTVWFVHSSYLDPVAVIAEEASKSDAFLASDTYVIGALTPDDAFVKKWLKETNFSVPGR